MNTELSTVEDEQKSFPSHVWGLNAVWEIHSSSLENLSEEE